jgi:23S rRNA-/tRNA-specific pseudouridylate synthase
MAGAIPQTAQVLLVEHDADRADVFLSENIPGLSRRRAREACEAGQVLCNGKRLRPGAKLYRGDEVRLLSPEWDSTALAEVARREQPGRGDLVILFEHERYLLVEKPRAMSSVRLRREDELTLADCLAAYDEHCLSASPDRREAGLLQRLDYFTAGILLAARDREAWALLRTELFEGRIGKTYLALVEGWPAARKFDLSFALQQSSDGKKMEPASVGGDAFSAQTAVEVLGSFSAANAEFSLVRATANRVRRHQIRLHLSAAGHPLVGDVMYGACTRLAQLAVNSLEDGFLLYAEQLSFRDPFSGERRMFCAQSPDVTSLSREHGICL